jgi:RNA recognition motif-containing protein
MASKFGKFEVRRPENTVWIGGLPEGTSHTEVLEVMRQVGACKHAHVGKGGVGFAYFSSPEEAEAAVANLNGVTVNGVPMQVDTYAKKPSSKGQQKGKGKGAKSSGHKHGISLVQKPQFQKLNNITGALYAQKQELQAKLNEINGALSLVGGNGGKGSKGGKGGKGKEPAFRVVHDEATVWIGNLADGVTHADLLPVMNQAGKCRRVQVTKNGQGFAWFATADEAQSAIAFLNGTEVMGKHIQLDTYVKKGKA